MPQRAVRVGWCIRYTFPFPFSDVYPIVCSFWVVKIQFYFICVDFLLEQYTYITQNQTFYYNKNV